MIGGRLVRGRRTNLLPNISVHGYDVLRVGGWGPGLIESLLHTKLGLTLSCHLQVLCSKEDIRVSKLLEIFLLDDLKHSRPYSCKPFRRKKVTQLLLFAGVVTERASFQAAHVFIRA